MSWKSLLCLEKDMKICLFHLINIGEDTPPLVCVCVRVCTCSYGALGAQKSHSAICYFLPLMGFLNSKLHTHTHTDTQSQTSGYFLCQGGHYKATLCSLWASIFPHHWIILCVWCACVCVYMCDEKSLLNLLGKRKVAIHMHAQSISLMRFRDSDQYGSNGWNRNK